VAEMYVTGLPTAPPRARQPPTSAVLATRNTMMRELLLGSELGYEDASTNLAWLVSAAAEEAFYRETRWYAPRRGEAARGDGRVSIFGPWVRRWMQGQHRFVVHGEGAAGLVTAARSRLLPAGAASQAGVLSARLLNAAAVELYETAAHSNAFAAMRAGDAAFYGGLGGRHGSGGGGGRGQAGQGGAPRTARNLTRARSFYQRAARLEREAAAAAVQGGVIPIGEVGSSSDGGGQVPEAALAPGVQAEAARSWHAGGAASSWQGAYAVAHMMVCLPVASIYYGCASLGYLLNCSSFHTCFPCNLSSPAGSPLRAAPGVGGGPAGRW
jgi:hypothetical protein